MSNTISANFGAGPSDGLFTPDVLAAQATGRNVTKELNDRYVSGQITKEQYINAITTGTNGAGPVYDPTKGPVIDYGQGPQQLPVGASTDLSNLPALISQNNLAPLPVTPLQSSTGASSVSTTNAPAGVNSSLNALPGETYEQYQARLGAVQGGGTGTGFGTPQPFNPTGAINSGNLQNQQGLTPQTQQNSPTYDVSGLSDLFKMTPTEQTAQSYIQKLQDLNNQLTGQAAYQQAQEAAQGIPELLKTQNDLAAQLKAITNEAAAIPLQLQKEATGRGITDTILGRQQTSRLRDNAIQALGVSSLLAASQGNLALANDLVAKAVEAKFGPIKEQITAATNNLNLIMQSPQYSLEDKQRAFVQAQVQAQKQAQLDLAQSNQENIYKIALTAAQNGASATVLQQIQASTTPQQALEAASKAGVFTDTNVDTQVVEINGQKVLINSKTGQTIKSLGSSGSGGGGATAPGENPQLYSGLTSATATAVRGQVSQFKSEPTIQNFAVVQEGRNFASSIANNTTNPADDQALIYALAKALDPGSVVREGEYATAQKYAQSWVQAYGKGVTQALLGTGFLSETARTNIKKTIEQKYSASKTSYDNVYNQYVSKIGGLTGRSDGSKFLTDYVTSPANTLAGNSSGSYTPGTVVEYNGQRYTVGADGDTLIPLANTLAPAKKPFGSDLFTGGL